MYESTLSIALNLIYHEWREEDFECSARAACDAVLEKRKYWHEYLERECQMDLSKEEMASIFQIVRMIRSLEPKRVMQLA